MTNVQWRALQGVLFCAVGGICWGFSGTVAQYLMAEKGLSAAWISMARMIYGGGLLAIWGLVKERRHFFALWRDPRGITGILIYGMIGLILAQYAFVLAIRHANAGTATMLQYTGPIGVLLYVCWQQRRRPAQRELAAILLAVSGTFFIATHGNPNNLVIAPEALFWGMMGALGLMISTIVAEPLVIAYGSICIAAWSHLIGGMTMGIFGTSLLIPLPTNLGTWLGIASLILIGTIGAFGFFMQGLGMIGSVKASMIGCMEPVSAALFSALIMHTIFMPMDLLGFACILATIFLLAK